MATWNFRTFTQSSGPDTFEAGEVALDVIKIPVAELLATFPSLAIGDDVYIRNVSGLRQYVPDLCYIYSDSTVTAGNANVCVDFSNANVLVTGASMAAGPILTEAVIGGWTYALNHTTPDGGSGVLLHMTALPVGTGNITVQIATRAAQS